MFAVTFTRVHSQHLRSHLFNVFHLFVDVVVFVRHDNKEQQSIVMISGGRHVGILFVNLVFSNTCVSSPLCFRNDFFEKMMLEKCTRANFMI